MIPYSLLSIKFETKRPTNYFFSITMQGNSASNIFVIDILTLLKLVKLYSSVIQLFDDIARRLLNKTGRSLIYPLCISIVESQRISRIVKLI